MLACTCGVTGPRRAFAVISALSAPLMIRTIPLAFWNDWFLALLYIRTNNAVIPLQYLLMKMQRNADFLAKNSHMMGAEASQMVAQLPSQSLKMALVVLIVVPIACAYPFFQRYLVAGLTIGSVKG